MANILYNKKAAMTIKQIIFMIILIVSFVIILFFIFRLSPKETADKQICHDSVVLRGNSIIGGQTIPLNCKTNYLCVSMDSGCDSPYTKDPDRVIEVDSQKEVYEFFANEMADCWWMYGEGKIDYLGESPKLFQTPYCSFCSLVAFDSNMERLFPKSEYPNGIPQEELYQYLIDTKISGEEITYADYFLEKAKKISDLLPTDPKTGKKTEFGFIALDKSHYVVTAIYKPVSGWAWAATIGAFIVSPVLGGINLAIILYDKFGTDVTKAREFVSTSIKGSSGRTYIPPTVIEIGSGKMDTLECKDVKSLS